MAISARAIGSGVTGLGGIGLGAIGLGGMGLDAIGLGGMGLGGMTIGGVRPRLLLALAILAGTAPLAGGASAQNYPWCANFHDGAGTNCGFSTEAQCRATVMGSGGFCDRNVQYMPPGAPAPTRRKATRSYSR